MYKNKYLGISNKLYLFKWVRKNSSRVLYEEINYRRTYKYKEKTKLLSSGEKKYYQW